MKKAVVTGGAGFIGSHLVDRLISMGVEVSVIDNLSSGKVENINKMAKFYELDISDDNNFDKICKIMEKSDVVFHLASKARVQPSIKDPILFNKHNVSGTLNVLFASYKEKVKKFIYSSSSSVYGNNKTLPFTEDLQSNPLSPYALQKLIGEQYCKLFSEVYNMDIVCLRYFNVYGERQLIEGSYCTVIGIFINCYKNNKKLPITNDGQQKRDFTYVGDVVNANILASINEKKFNCEIFNIGSGFNHSINEISSLFNQEVEFIGEVLEPFETKASNEKAKKILSWEPSQDVIHWIKNYLENEQIKH